MIHSDFRPQTVFTIEKLKSQLSIINELQLESVLLCEMLSFLGKIYHKSCIVTSLTVVFIGTTCKPV